MNTNRIASAALCGTVAAFSLCLTKLPAAEDTLTVSAILLKHAQESQLSPALEEVVKLSKAGVAESVTLAYIQTSPTAYALDAQDILRLREQGVSSPVVTAMMQHGDELRRAAATASQQNQSTALARATPLAAPAPAPVSHAPSSSYPANSVSVTYIGYPRHEGYSGYFGYGYGGWSPSYYNYAPRYGYGYFGPRVGFGLGYGVAYAGYSRGYFGGYGRCR